MGIFDNIGNVSSGFDSNYIQSGEYRAEVIKVEMTEKKDNSGIQFWCINMRITEVLNAGPLGITQDAEGKPLPHKTHRVGEEVTHLIKRQSQTFFQNVKQFLDGCSNGKFSELPHEKQSATADLAVSAEQPIAGKEIGFRATTVLTKANRKPFTKVFYTGLVDRGEAQEEAAA